MHKYDNDNTPSDSHDSENIHDSTSSQHDSTNNNEEASNQNDSTNNQDIAQKTNDEHTNDNLNSDKTNIIQSENIIPNENITRIIINSSNSEIIYKFLNDEQIISKCNFVNINNNLDIYNAIKENIIEIYNQKSQVIEGEDNKLYQITNTNKEMELLQNGDINNNYNLSIIDLSQCEIKLREEYHLNDDVPLIILKQETYDSQSSQKTIEYEVFEPYNKTKLNLSICNEDTINIYVPIELSEETKKIAEELKEKGYDIFNINDPFYTDICTSYKSEDGTDMLLSDRIDYIYNNNDAKCQPNCKFSNYIQNTQYINCTCNINENLEDKNVKFIPKKFYESFIDVLKYSNVDILKCYKLVFHINSITKNIGSIIVLITFIIYLICLIFYIIRGKIYLARKLNNILKKNGKLYLFNNYKINDQMQIDTKIAIKENIIKTENDINNPPKKKFKKKNNFRSSKTLITKFNNKEAIPSDFYKPTLVGRNKNSLNSVNSNEKWNYSGNKSSEEEDIKVEAKINNIVYDGFELNDLDYEEAIKYDKRSFFEIYWNTLKREQIILFTFISYNDYNYFNIKLAKLTFLITTDMAMNVLFFSDDSMHKIFLNYGKYDFVQQIVQIIYSTIISQLLEVFLCFLSLIDTYFYHIKNLTPPNESSKAYELLKCMRKKLIIFFIFTFLFFGFYWYVIAVFCAVYENTQIIFLKDSILSFVFGIAYSIILYLIPTILRLCAIKYPKQNLKCIYKLSGIIPFF